MSTPSSSPALPLARLLLRILIAVNWLWGAAIVVLLFAMPHREWILSALKLSGAPDADRVVLALRATAVLGLVVIPVNHVFLTRLLAIVETVRARNPFVAANAQRLQTMAWAMVALQLLGLTIGAIIKAVSTPAHPINVDTGGGSLTGWLAILLTFLLARVFAEGAHMREELEGTV